MKLVRFTFALIWITLMLVAGCATDTPQTTRRYVWPRPPDPPKIEWIKSYYSQHDFPKSGFDSAMELFFGQPYALTFEKPIDIKSNSKGIVYIADIVLGAIVVYDLNNYKIDLWERGSDPDKNLSVNPYFLALDKEDNIYAVGSGMSRIYILNSNGSVIKWIDFTGIVKYPAGIAVDSEGERIYLVDSGDSKVAVFDLSGKHLFSFGKPGREEGELNRPSPIAINHKGELVIGDTLNARVQIFSKEGKFLRKFGQRGDGGPDFQVLKGLSVDSDDNIYVTDGKANQIKIFSTKGEYLMSLGTAYSVTQTLREAPGGFLLPQGIHIDDTDTIYVSDQANMRFQIFSYLGGKSKTAPSTTPAVLQKK